MTWPLTLAQWPWEGPAPGGRGQFHTCTAVWGAAHQGGLCVEGMSTALWAFQNPGEPWEGQALAQCSAGWAEGPGTWTRAVLSPGVLYTEDPRTVLGTVSGEVLAAKPHRPKGREPTETPGPSRSSVESCLHQRRRERKERC